MLLLCKEEGSSPVSSTERRQRGVNTYAVELPLFA